MATANSCRKTRQSFVTEMTTRIEGMVICWQLALRCQRCSSQKHGMAVPWNHPTWSGVRFWCYRNPQHTAKIRTKFKAIRMGQKRRREITTFEKAMFVSTSTPQNIRATHHDTALLSVSTQESRNRSLLHSIGVLYDLPSLAVTCHLSLPVI